MSEVSMYKQQDLSALTAMVKDVQASESQANANDARIAARELQVAQKQEENDPNNQFLQMSKKNNEKIKPHSSTVKKAKEKAEAKLKLMPPGQLKDFLSKNPQFKRFESLVPKLKDGMSKKDILDLVNAEYPNSEDAQLAFEFLSQIAKDEFKETVNMAFDAFHDQVSNKREKEYTKKIEEELKASQAVSEESARLAKTSGTLEEQVKFAEHLIANPIEAGNLFKLIDDNNPNVIPVYKTLIHIFGKKINRLKELDDKDNVVEMKGVIAALQKTKALLWIEKTFEIRNK